MAEVKFRGFIFIKEGEKYYSVNTITKLADEPNAYVLQVRNPETKEDSSLKIKTAGLFDAIDSAFEGSILIVNADSGEWKSYTYDQLSFKLKRLYFESKRNQMNAR